MDVWVLACVPRGFLKVEPAFRVIRSHTRDEQELSGWKLLLHKPVTVDDAQRVLPRVEAPHLGNYGLVSFDFEAV
jgi:hypothetical protein